MTAELQWRRRWKPDLKACSWKPLHLGNEGANSSHRYFIKTKFDDSSYEFLITDLTNFWYERLADASLKKRVSKLNPSIEAPLTKILDQIKQNVESPGRGTQLTVKEENDDITVKINSELAGMPFCYSFKAEPASQEMGRDHLTIPLMAMVGELYRQQQELFRVLADKDKQIDDYKAQGAQVSRKYLDTVPFDEVIFRNNMVTSKGFEAEVKTYGEKAFTSLGQSLYRDITTKRAWLQSSPAKDGDLDNGEPMESVSGAQGGPSAESWSGRLPASMAHKTVSPSKTAATSDISPKKSPARSPASSKGSSAESTPAKDTEMMRRQALERKLELEEAKQQEKVKKKKKLKF